MTNMDNNIEEDLRIKLEEMKLKERKSLEFYHFLRDNDCILFESIVGSQAHGLATPESDVDKSFVYILPQDFIYGTNYIDHLKVNKDFVGYEIKRFLELLQNNNPTALELLNTPKDCHLIVHSVFQRVLQMRDEFLTKKSYKTFTGYSRKMISKARGLDKKRGWEASRVTRKEVSDFCFIIDGHGTIPLKKYLEDSEKDQIFCGITKIPNARDVFALFYDFTSHHCFSERIPKFDREEYKKMLKSTGKSVGNGYKGVVKSNSGLSLSESNQLRLSEIPKGEVLSAIMIYNKDSYTKSCKDFSEYQEWLENRNEQRWVDNEQSGQQYDGKNLLHNVRSLQIAREIAENGTLNLRRKNRTELLNIKTGKSDPVQVINWSEQEIIDLEKVYENSGIKDDFDSEVINELVIGIRKDFYSKK